MNLSLEGSQMSNEATSKQSSVCKGAGYDKVFGSGHEPKDFSWSSERETSAQSPNDNVESYDEENEEEVVNEDEDKVEEGEGERESDGDEDDGDEESYEGTSRSPRGNCPFILPRNWIVNNFLPKMSDRVFKELCTHY